ncbi:MAG: hypothetical protein IK111_06910 [Lachnospiraceae bacterium]|nr:hypothetical protein [Lachnospiraceae bacterium]
MKNKIKRLLLTIGSIVPVLMISGCAHDGKPTFAFWVTNADAMKYMEEKYGEKFILEDRKPSDIIYDEQTDVFCHTVDMDRNLNEHAKVYLLDDEKGVHFSDSYFGYYIRPQVEEYVYENLKDIYPEVKAFYTPGTRMIDDSLTTESTLDDYFDINENRLRINIFIKKDPDITVDEYEASVKKAAEPFADRGNRWLLFFYVVSDNVYDKTDRKTELKLRERISGHRLKDDEQVFMEVHMEIGKGEILSYKTF